MRCIWCSEKVIRKGSKRVPYWHMHWRNGSMHSGCFSEFDSIYTFGVPQAYAKDGKFDFWITASKGRSFTLSPVKDAFAWLEEAKR